MNPPTVCEQVGGPVCRCCVDYRLAVDRADRLEVQLDRVRAELAATVANIAAWDDVLADVMPALHEQMGND